MEIRAQDTSLHMYCCLLNKVLLIRFGQGRALCILHLAIAKSYICIRMCACSSNLHVMCPSSFLVCTLKMPLSGEL